MNSTVLVPPCQDPSHPRHGHGEGQGLRCVSQHVGKVHSNHGNKDAYLGHEFFVKAMAFLYNSQSFFLEPTPMPF